MSTSSGTTWRAAAVLAVAGVVLAPERTVDACGPDFPTNVLLRRADALATLWDGSFLDEAARLVAVPARDRAAFAAAPAPVEPVEDDASAPEHARYREAAARFYAGAGAEAARGFEAVLRLPAHARRQRAAAAAYSLGRAREALGDGAGAIAAYRRVRALVRHGFADGDGLAISSLGQEARVRWAHHGDLVAAVRLYAEQAAHDPGGGTSLLHVVRGATAPSARAALYRDDVGTALVALYVYTRGHELDDAQRAVWERELARQVTSEARGAAYMAARAYRGGDWAAAARYAKLCRRAPLATWVRAKLALRGGDRATAEALMRAVERTGLTGAHHAAAHSLDAAPRSRVRAELGILALAGERFAEAAGGFVRADRLVEAAYVVERVMSRDELFAEVQRTAPARAADASCDGGELDDALRDACWGRHVLEIHARRAMRDGRYADALAAFGPDHDAAHAYVTALRRADASAGVERAEHLLRAARTLRAHGLEIAGTEVGPDWNLYRGDFERDMPAHDEPALVSPREAARVRASAPELDRRYSYRYAASQLAERAAALLPPRSQAYATTLCWAAKLASRDPARVEELYATYVRNGALGFSDGFGARCAEPDFQRARTFDADRAEHRLRAAIAAERRRAWTWPRLRDAVWRRRAWLVYPPLALAVAGLLLVMAARARTKRRTARAVGRIERLVGRAPPD